MIDKETDAPEAHRAAPHLDDGNRNGAPPWLDDEAVARYTHHSRLPPHAKVGLDPELADALDAHSGACRRRRPRAARRGPPPPAPPPPTPPPPAARRSACGRSGTAMPRP